MRNLRDLYEKNAFIRAMILWLAFMALLWSAFGVGLAIHPEAWRDVPPPTRDTGWDVLLFILAHNGLLLGLIVVGNLFVRFGVITPGLLILAWQAVNIGWIAGTNAFMEPFPSVAAANAAFLRIGLWEITAYVLIGAATLPKSCLISDEFPPQSWAETRALTDLRFTSREKAVIAGALISFLGAALMEAF